MLTFEVSNYIKEDKQMENSVLIQNMTEDSLRKIIREELSEIKLKPDVNFKTRAELAKKLRVSLVSFDKAVREGKIPGYRLNGKLLFKETDLDLEKIHFKGKK